MRPPRGYPAATRRRGSFNASTPAAYARDAAARPAGRASEALPHVVTRCHRRHQAPGSGTLRRLAELALGPRGCDGPGVLNGVPGTVPFPRPPMQHAGYPRTPLHGGGVPADDCRQVAVAHARV